MRPIPLENVDETEAIGLAGPGLDVFPVSGATVAVGSVSTVIIAEAGDDPAVSGVWNAEQFRLIGPAPSPVTSRLMGPMDFTTAGVPPKLPIHLFVRLDAGCLYLGVVRVSMCEAGEGVLTRCNMGISPPLSRELLDLVRPPATPPPLPDLDWLGDVDTVPGRALERFVTGWHPESGTQAPDVDVPDFIPRALADFYRLAARRPAVLGGHNRITPVGELRPDDGAELLVFGVECQGAGPGRYPGQRATPMSIPPCGSRTTASRTAALWPNRNR